MYVLIFLIFFGAGIGCMWTGARLVIRLAPMACRYLLRLLSYRKLAILKRATPSVISTPAWMKQDWENMQVPTAYRKGILIY